MRSTIYCDEAGFTGGDLLNLQQPYFVYGSTDLVESEASRLITEAVSRYKLQRNGELKGANLFKTGTGRSALKWLMNESAGHFHVVFAQKQFAIAAKFFEAFFEPLIADRSTFFYGCDFHRFISNAIYLGLRTKNTLAISAIENIQAIFRKGSIPVAELFDANEIVLQDLIGSIFYFLQLNEEKISPLLSDYQDRSQYKWYLDLSLSSLHTSLIFWSKKYDEMDVICDDSKPIAENADVVKLSGLAAGGLSILRPTEIAKYKVSSLEFGRSHELAGLQLADLFASSACSALNNRDKFFDDMVENHPRSFGNFNVRPDQSYVDFKNGSSVKNGLILLRLIGECQKTGVLKLTDELMAELKDIRMARLR